MTDSWDPPKGPATLQNWADNRFGMTPYCEKCGSRGHTMTPVEVSERFQVPMTTPIPQVRSMLVCKACGAKAGYFHIENPGLHPAIGGRRSQ
jgi:hypothetical protein